MYRHAWGEGGILHFLVGGVELERSWAWINKFPVGGGAQHLQFGAQLLGNSPCYVTSLETAFWKIKAQAPEEMGTIQEWGFCAGFEEDFSNAFPTYMTGVFGCSGNYLQYLNENIKKTSAQRCFNWNAKFIAWNKADIKRKKKKES